MAGGWTPPPPANVNTAWYPVPTENMLMDPESLNYVFPFDGDVYYGIVVSKNGDYSDILVEGVYEDPTLLKGACYAYNAGIVSIGTTGLAQENAGFYVGWCYEDGKLLLGAKPAKVLAHMTYDPPPL